VTVVSFVFEKGFPLITGDPFSPMEGVGMEDEMDFLVLGLMFDDKYSKTWGKDYYEFIRLDTLRKWSWQSVPGDRYLGNLPPQNFMDIAVIRMYPSYIERIEHRELKFDMGLAFCYIEDPKTGRMLWRKNMGEENGTWFSEEEQAIEE
jgi:hypothetical protein